MSLSGGASTSPKCFIVVFVGDSFQVNIDHHCQNIYIPDCSRICIYLYSVYHNIIESVDSISPYFFVTIKS